MAGVIKGWPWNDINNIVDQCKKVNHVFDLSNYGIMPMRAELFEYAIKNGKYDDNILLEFTNYSKSIAEKAKTVAVDLPNLSDANSHQSINDNDYGYNLSIKPQYDKSFVSFSYKLLNYKVCSIKLFIKDFGMSMDRAKDFMYKLLYLNMVSGKDQNGNRKVLIETENELEYKLSWIFPNDSWRY